VNKFLIFPCIEQKDEGYQGQVVTLASTSNATFVLFFPIATDYASLINYVLKKDNSPANYQLLSVYQTMLDSWKAADRYLSGIVMDIMYDEETEEDIIAPTLILCDSLGNVDAVLNVHFVHAVMLAAMERKEVLVTNELLDKLLKDPQENDEDEEEFPPETDGQSKTDSNLPIDKQILDIARDIMSGKKNDPKDTNGDEVKE